MQKSTPNCSAILLPYRAHVWGAVNWNDQKKRVPRAPQTLNQIFSRFANKCLVCNFSVPKLSLKNYIVKRTDHTSRQYGLNFYNSLKLGRNMV